MVGAQASQPSARVVREIHASPSRVATRVSAGTSNGTPRREERVKVRETPLPTPFSGRLGRPAADRRVVEGLEPVWKERGVDRGERCEVRSPRST